MAHISVRFLIKNSDGSYIAIKGNQYSDPILSRNGNATDSVPGAGRDAKGVPIQYKSYTSGSPKLFDWTKNSIYESFSAYMITVGAGTEELLTVNTAGGTEVKTIPGPAADRAWALHFCARGRASAEATSGLLNGSCTLDSRNCSGSSDKFCLRWCQSDVDGCIDTWDYFYNQNNWQIERPPQPPGGGGDKTNYGYHSELVTVLQDFRNNAWSGVADYDGLFTFNARVNKQFFSKTNMRNILIYTPPIGYNCGSVISYDGNNNSQYWPILDDTQKSDIGIDTSKCAIEFNGTQLKKDFVNVALVILEKKPVSECFVSADGRPELTINTANRTVGLGPPGRVSFISNSNDSSHAQAGRAILRFIKTNPNVAYNQTLSVPNGFLAANQSTPNKFYRDSASPGDLIYTTVCPSSNNVVCSELGSLFGYRQAFWNTPANPATVLDSGTYYAYCEVPYGASACRGNPRCAHEGGSTVCNPALSCSESSTGSFEEIAIRRNLVKYRILPLQDTGAIKWTGANDAWQDGPFSIANSITAQGGQVLALALLDVGNTVQTYFWTKYPGSGALQLNRFAVSKSADGLPNWAEITTASSPTQVIGVGSYISGANAPLAGGVEPTAHGLLIRPDTNKVLEYIYVLDATGATKGYFRELSYNANGIITTGASVGGWYENNFATGPGGTRPALTMGAAVVPTTDSANPRVFQGYTSLSGTTPTQWRRETLWSQVATTPFDNASGIEFINKIFGSGLSLDAYDALYLTTGINDKVKISVQCLPTTYDVCSAGGNDGCGVTNRPPGPLAGLGAVTNIQISPAANTIPPDNRLTITWNELTKADTYELVAWPDGDFVTPNDAYDVAGHAITAKNLTTTSYELDLDFLPASSPKIRVAIRAVNVCGPAPWVQANYGVGTNTNPPTVRLTSPVRFQFREVATNTCVGPGGDLTHEIAASYPLSVGVNKSGGPSTFDITSSPVAPIVNPTINNATKNNTHSSRSVWYAPNAWFTSGFYSLNPDTIALSRNNYVLACTSNIRGLNAPAVTEPVPIYIRPAYDPWWQVRGGNARAATGKLLTLIPLECVNNPANCMRSITAAATFTANNANTKTAGIPIAGTNIFRTQESIEGANQAGNRQFSQNWNTLARSSEFAAPPFNYSDLSRDVNDFLAAQGKSATTISGNVDNLPSFFTDSNRITTSNGKHFYIFQAAGNINLRPPSNGTGWQIPSDAVVVVLAGGNITLRHPTGASTTTTGPAIDVVDGGFLLVAANGNITVHHNVGRAASRVASGPVGENLNPPVSLEGIYMANGTLTIADDSNDSVSDNQFIGKGSFIGLTNVELARSFQGLYDGTNEGRPLHNLNATEVFIFDPSLVRNTPLFLGKPILTYKEVN